MSTRAIASGIGVSQDTVNRELARERNRSPESEPSPVTGTDGKTYTPRPLSPFSLVLVARTSV